MRDLDDQQVAALALIENIQREQLTAIEQARALARMRDEFSMDQTALAAMISSSRSNVANLLRLLNLAQSVQTMRNRQLRNGACASAFTASRKHATENGRRCR